MERLTELRKSMASKAIDAYIILSGDPHLGENIPDSRNIILWLTGFTGSSASLVITSSFAGLWTDSRYFIQAQDQLKGSGFSFIKQAGSISKNYTGWLAENLETGSRIGFDGKIVSLSEMRRMEKAVHGLNADFVTDADLISEIRIDPPPLTGSQAFDFPVVFSGKDRAAKIAEMRVMMKEMGADYHLLTSVDDIMWLLNIRGSDVPYSPLLNSLAVAGEDQILLFTDEERIPFKMAGEFDNLGVVVLPYLEAGPVLSSFPEESSILVTPASASVSLYNYIPRGMRIIEDISIPGILKTVKNRTEIENISKAMVSDGIALTRFFYWLEQQAETDGLTETVLEEKLTGFRSEQEYYKGTCFRSIVAYNEHSALPHYTALQGSDAVIGKQGILLIDSGGQYLTGTTDITRTIAIGIPSNRQKRDYTLVLKGHISLAMAKIPAGTCGIQLDILARGPLWSDGLNYGHGTGHGVGFFLNVHEGPLGISPADNSGSLRGIEPGMIFSDEPAVYREGEYGIRTENLLVCYEDEETEFGQFLRFETVSLCFLDKSLIDTALLDRKEIAWINDYHATVYDKIGPHLTDNEKSWLAEKTEPL